MKKFHAAVTDSANDSNGYLEKNIMDRLISFFRSDLFLSLAGGFALGVAALAIVKPASAVSEKNETRAVLIEGNNHAAQSTEVKGR